VASEKSLELARRAEELYTGRLQATLEPAHDGEFVAIEPASGDYFLGDSLSAAIAAARRAHPHRIAYAKRVGDRVAVHLGAARR
jgi:hypothetical protein